jgi:hypothetical protein
MNDKLKEMGNSFKPREVKPPVYFFTMHTDGSIRGPGYSSDGTLGPNCIECTKDQYDNHNDYEIHDRVIVPMDPAKISARNLKHLAKANKRVADRLMATAGLAIAPLSDASELGVSTPQEQALLTEWKKYRILLGRVDLTSKEPAWPVVPN